jgi:hypothetical protein
MATETTEVEGAVISVDGGDPVALVNVDRIIEGEVLPPEGEEPPVSDAVAIAAIEAQAEVAIAEIQSETAIELDTNFTAREEARAEAEEGNGTWREEVAGLRTSLQELSLRVEELALLLVNPNPLTPPPSMEPEAEMTLTPQSTSDATSETPMEASPESVEESPAPAEEPSPAPARRRRRPI